MGMTLFYKGNPHSFADRFRDMKHALFQEKEYDLDTELGKENTWKFVNGMLLATAVCLLGEAIEAKMSEPTRKKNLLDAKQTAFREGQIHAYRQILDKPDILMNAGMKKAEKDPNWKTFKF